MKSIFVILDLGLKLYNLCTMSLSEITPCFVELSNRGLITVGGPDAFKFLQNLITNDLTKLRDSLHACLLTAQGKFLHDFFVTRYADGYRLDCEGGERARHLLKLLTLYRLRASVTLDIIEQHPVYVTLPENIRYFEKPEIMQADFAVWDRWRIANNIADGSRDAEIEKSTLAELNMDDAIDYNKGCYIGQELTARIHHRGLSKRHLFPVKFKGPVPAFGEPVLYDGKVIGEMRSSNGETGLALLKDELLPERQDGFVCL